VSEEYLKKKFCEYYSSSRLKFPPSAEMREWGFIFFDGAMHRHRSFSSIDQISEFIRRAVPLHIYHSSAYYSNPSADMRWKGWLGADLIFDLDMDPEVLPPEERSYENLLETVKSETIKLLDFLKDDFGLRDIHVVFSGGRGYHVHVRDEEVKRLSSRGRREILDYLSGTRLDIKKFLKREGFGKFKSLKMNIRGGWGRRLGRNLSFLLKEISEMEDSDAIAKIRESGISKRHAENLVRLSKKPELLHRVEKGEIDQVSDFPWERFVERMKIGISTRADQPVTADVNRLIRLPNSLHGGSGLIAAEVGSLDDFDPLYDAVVFGEEEVEVKMKKSAKVKLKGNDFFLAKEKEKVPEYVAVHLLCRGLARI
jgi:DNA primase small subunit